MCMYCKLACGPDASANGRIDHFGWEARRSELSGERANGSRHSEESMWPQVALQRPC